MKLPSYKKVLKYSKEKIQESLAPIRAIQAKKQAELEMAKLDEDIATNEAKLHEICAALPISFHEIIRVQNQIDLTKRKKKQFEEIIKQLFESDDEE